MRRLLETLLVTAPFVCLALPCLAAEITGVVRDSKSGAPLAGVNVFAVGTTRGSASASNGTFEITGLEPGTYAIEASMIGYERKRLEIALDDEQRVVLDFNLSEEAIALREIVVTPGRFSLAAKAITARQALKREDIRSFPQLGEDIYRAVTRLPGLSGSDYSSRFAIRGGEQDEVLVMLDGLQLYDPFHLKDFGGSVSVIDVEAIGSIDMMTGAFSAEFGDRQSGVFNITTANPNFGQRRTSVALSFMNARFLTEGSFAEGRGQWMVLGRRGYLDIVLKFVDADDDFSPFFYDVLGKVKYQFSDHNHLSLNVLRSDDNLDFNDNGLESQTGYGSTYAWSTWRSSITDQLFKQTVLSFGHITTARKGIDRDAQPQILNFDVYDDRSFNFVGLRQDWTYELSRRFFLKFGGELKSLSSDYNYSSIERGFTQIVNGQIAAEFDTSSYDLSPSGEQMAAYLSTRVRLSAPFTAEVGVRYDYASWTKDNKLGPRLNLAYAIGEQTSLRLGWGKFYQSQGIHELDIQDGDDTFYPAELAEHRVVGIEHKFNNDIQLRVEGYQKKMSDLRPWSQNLLNDLNMFPEMEGDRVRLFAETGEAKGIEIFLTQDEGGKINWWASYGYAFAKDNIYQINQFPIQPGLNSPRAKINAIRSIST